MLAYPGSLRTTLDPAVLASDPNIGPEAALSAFDTHFETGLFWNGGGRSLGSAFSSGALGVFSQPTTMAKVGLGRTLRTGTKVSVGGVGGYDWELAGGLYAAYGCELRPSAGARRRHRVQLYCRSLRKTGRLPRCVDRSDRCKHGSFGVGTGRSRSGTRCGGDLLGNCISPTGILTPNGRRWSTLCSHGNANRTALPSRQADLTSRRSRDSNTTPADAAVQNAISGTGRDPAGVYGAESKLRALLGLPATDGKLIRPEAHPLEAEFHFDWNEALQLAQTRRVELRKQLASLEKRELELKAARNLRRPQVDVVGQYRSLADDQDDQTTLFSEALHGWQVGIEVTQALGRRREHAAVRNAELRLSRERAQMTEQERAVAAELRLAFTELDRSFGVTQSLAVSRDAARIPLQAEAERHAAGDTHIERVLEAQTRATQAETSYQRSLVDYNLAFIELHFVRGTLLDMLGVGFFDGATSDEASFAHNVPSAFAASGHDDCAVWRDPATEPLVSAASGSEARRPSSLTAR